MNKLNIYNFKSGKIEEFKSIEENNVKMYVCGPTVYDFLHIGNARPIVIFDLLRKVLEADGYQVEYISNVTDVDDRIIEKALSEKVEEKVITDRYLAAYLKLRESLKVGELAAMPKATEAIDNMIDFVKKLIDTEYAYEIDGDVYFRVNKIADYGEYSKQVLAELEVGARVDEDTRKENPWDFALWKKTDKGIKWNSVFGEGRPGWHTECVVMINSYFHTKIDIHGGGLDLRFPHHENEIAQAKAAFGHDIANYWIYNGMINIDGVKISKSIGNVRWAQELVDKLGANVVRWILLGSHYRLQMQFSDELLTQAKNELEKIHNALKQAWLKLALADQKGESNDDSAYQAFLACLNDDLNTPNAYAQLFDTAKEINQQVRNSEADINVLASRVKSLEKMLELLSIEFPRLTLTDNDRYIYNEWLSAKAEKDFDKADQLRATLSEKGIL